jgi:hypothetical protein
MPRHRKIVEFVEAQIAVPINEAEQRQKAFELARVCGELDEMRANAALAAGEVRKRIRALALQQRQLAECVRTGTEMRNATGDLFDAAASKKSKGANGATP